MSAKKTEGEQVTASDSARFKIGGQEFGSDAEFFQHQRSSILQMLGALTAPGRSLSDSAIHAQLITRMESRAKLLARAVEIKRSEEQA